MKALALLTAAALTLFSVAGAYAQTYGTPYGKGKAPPPPVVTKGEGDLRGDRPLCRSLSFLERLDASQQAEAGQR